MSRLPTLAALIVSSLCAGCAVGPDYLRPTSPMPQAYMGTRTQAQETAPVFATDSDLSAWWLAFGDPQLTQFVTLALQQNLDLAQALARVRQARAQLDAAGAALLPAGNVTAQTSRGYQSLQTPLGQVLNAVPDFARYGNAHEANLGVSWEVDLFGGLKREQQAAHAEYQATQADAVAVRLAVAAQAADTVLQIRGLQARLAIARQQVQTQQQLRSTIELRWHKGLAAELQLRQAQGALARAQATIPPLEAALETAMNAMDVMLGDMPGTHRAAFAQLPPSPGLSGLSSIPGMSLGSAPADLLRRRPDVIAAERRLAASNARIGAAIAEYYPKISLSGLIGSATSLSSGQLFSGGASQVAAVAGLRWRLFDFGRINAQLAQAEASEAGALAAYRQAVLRATEDVENALLARERRQELSAVLAQGEHALARAREASAAAYDKGVVSLIEVLQADESLLSVRDAQAQAGTDSARALVAIFKALGGGWTPEPTPLVVSQ